MSVHDRAMGHMCHSEGADLTRAVAVPIALVKVSRLS